MAGDSAGSYRWVTALLDSTDPFHTVPRGHSKPHPNLTGSPTVQTTVLRIYPIFHMEKLRPQAKICFFPPGHPEFTSEYSQRSLVLFTWGFLGMFMLLEGAQTGSAGAGLIWIPHRRNPELLLIPCSPGHTSLPVL